MNTEVAHILTVMTGEQLLGLYEGATMDAICKRLTQLAAQISPSSPPVIPTTLVSFFKHNGVLVVAYDKNGYILGMGTLVFTYKTTGITARIEHVVVDEPYRGRHISSKIVEALIEAAIAQQVRYVDLTTGHERIEANSLYLKMGFQLRRETNCYRLVIRT
jgi:ribosomal protein S18 acetylase RimI-like enzyme